MSKKEIENDEVNVKDSNEKETDTNQHSEVENNSEEQLEAKDNESETKVKDEQSDTIDNKGKKASKESELDTLKKELGEMKDKYLRIFAEFDNFRKRTAKEKQDLIKFASKGCIEAILPAFDDFARAIKMADEIENETPVPEGLKLIFSKLNKALEQQGLKVMETDGELFDPELHEALTKIPAPNDEMKGKIIETIEKGYYLNDKIVRYAKVVVGE